LGDSLQQGTTHLVCQHRELRVSITHVAKSARSAHRHRVE
jgi:hypothetical protein